MVELAATLFVIIVLSNFVIGFVNGIGGWGNAGFAVVLLIVAVGLIVLFSIGVASNGLGDTVFGVIVCGVLLYLASLPGQKKLLKSTDPAPHADRRWHEMMEARYGKRIV
jgi:hypothetical protein